MTLVRFSDWDLMSRHPSVEAITQFFDSSHLPAHLATIATKFEKLKDDVLEDVKEDTPEVMAGLRKLLEAKDCFVRAAVAIKKQSGELVKDVTE